MLDFSLNLSVVLHNYYQKRKIKFISPPKFAMYLHSVYLKALVDNSFYLFKERIPS